MSNWEEQVRQNAIAIQKIIGDALGILDLPTNSNLQGTDWAVVWSNANNRLEKVLVSTLTANLGWIWINGYYLSKGVGNVDLNALEVGDEVYYKKIDNNGDPITLVGHTYNGPDEDLESSYTQNQSISI
jgi:hypothetical protein